MATVPLSVQTLQNASLDAEDYAVVVNGNDTASTVNRAGNTLLSLANLQRRALQAIAGIGYRVPVPYTAGLVIDDPLQTVEYNDVVYAPLFSKLPFTTSGTFETANFRVVQGVVLSDLDAAIIAFRQAGIGAGERTVEDKLREVEITPRDFEGVGDGVADDTQPLKDAIIVAAATGCKLSLRSGVWRITSPIDFTGVRTLCADYYSYILADRSGTVAADSYAVSIGSQSGDAESGRAYGFTLEGQFALRCVSRSTPQCGISLKGSWLNIGHIHAEDFNGTGIQADSVWDSTAIRLRTERCGNVSKFALSIKSNGDTTNCFNVASVQCEASHHRGLEIDCIRSVIQNIHCERTYILTLNDGTTGLQSGKNYINHRFVLGNVEIQQAFIDAMPSGTAIPGGGTTPTGELNGTVYSGASVVSTMEFHGDLCVVDGTGGSFPTLTVNNLFQKGPASRTSFDGLNCSGVVSAEAYCTFSAPVIIGTFNAAFNGTNLRVIGGVVSTVNCTEPLVGDISFDGVKIGTVLNAGAPTGSGSVTTFNSCNIDTVNGAFGSFARFSAGTCKAVSLASNAFFDFDFVMGNSFAYTGTPAFLTTNCQFKTASWTLSVFGYPAGTRTQRLGYVAGQPVDYVNNGAITGPADWKPLTTAPA